MVNYYDILGISFNANHSEIKTAFRSLAKIYHPDVNPYGQEDFKKILRAYETLIDPSRKSSYDIKLKYHQNTMQSIKTAGTKTWSFEEKELKRRQYYNEHIKKYEKPKTSTNTKAVHSELKNNYNEYKYILFATPIAVALFLLVVNLAASPPKIKNLEIAKRESAKKIIKMGDSPYLEHFGSPKYDKYESKSLTVKNYTGLDVVVCLFNERGFLRSCFIQDGYYAEIPQLPKNKIIVKYSSGQNWNFELQLKETKLFGAFTKNLSFFKSVKATELGAINEITLLTGVNEGFKNINEQEFFNKD